LSFVCYASAHAGTDEAAQRFKAGSSAFQAGNYEAALEAFEAAVAAGLSGPAVHFNIGVTAYRLERYPDAIAAFEEVARTPAMAGLAYYNLGLVAVRQNASERARRWFSTVEQVTNDQRLRGLAATQLAELPPPYERNWLGYATFAAGYDDNVALVADADVLGISGTDDTFAELQLALSLPLDRPWRLDGGLSLVDYQTLDTFDQLGIHGGGRYRWDIGSWATDLGLQFAYSTLDGEGFENRRTLWLQTSSQLFSAVSARLRYRFNDIDGLNDFGALDGRRHEVSARIDWSGKPWGVSADYQFEVGDYDDASMSATRRQLRFDVERTIAGSWTVLFEAAHRYSLYDVASIGSEDRTELALSVTKAFARRWRFVLRHAYVNNDADLADFEYRGNRTTAGVEAIM
jgi:hypothetical protein